MQLHSAAENSLVEQEGGSVKIWSVGDVVEILTDHMPAPTISAHIVHGSLAFGHVIGLGRGEDGMFWVRIRQLLTSSQLPAVMPAACSCVYGIRAICSMQRGSICLQLADLAE